MKRITFILMTMMLMTLLPVYGQKETNIVYKVGVGEFIYTPPSGAKTNTAERALKDVVDVLLTGQHSNQEPQYAEAVRASIVSGLSSVIPFRPFDGGFTNSELASGISALFVDGTITNISTVTKTETSRDSKGKKTSRTYYSGLVSVTVNLKDAHDGTVIDSRMFSITDSETCWLSSTDKAINNALGYLTSRISKYYNKMFPLYASIVEGGESKKDKQKEVYIDLGAADGAYKGQQFDVFLVKTVAGKEAQTLIGRLKIKEVEGDDISLCKVTKGGDKIKAAIDDNMHLVITSR